MSGRERDPVLASALEAEASGDLEGAERLFRFLSRTKPEDQKINAGLARVLYKLDRVEEATVALATIPRETRSWREHLLQAKVDIRVGDFISAKSSLLLTRTLRPGTRAADLLMEYVASQLTVDEPESETVFEEEFHAFDQIQEFQDSGAVEEATDAQETEVYEAEVGTTDSN